MTTGTHRRIMALFTLCAIGSTLGIAAPAMAEDTPAPVVAVATQSPSPTPSTSETIPSGTAPAAPTNIKWSRNGKTGVTLSWTASAEDADHSAATSYTVQTTKDGSPIGGSTKVTGTSKKYTDIDPGTVLTTTVTAVNQFASSEPTDGPKWTQPAVVPSKPDAVTVTSVTYNSVKVSWGAPDDDGGAPVTAYVVRLYEGGDIYYEQTLDVVSTTDSFTNLMAGSKYHVEVLAVNSAGRSDAAVSRDIVLPKPSASPNPTKTVVVTPSSPPVVQSPSPSVTDTRLQQDIDKVRARQAELEAQQQAALTWTVVGVILVLLAGAITGLIFVIRYNRRVAAYNREHGYKS